MSNILRREARDFVLAKKADGSHYELHVNPNYAAQVVAALKLADQGRLGGHVPDEFHIYRERRYVLSPTRWLIKQAVA